MLRKRYGENWTILLRISQGSKVDNPEICTLKYFFKGTFHLFIFYYHVFFCQRLWHTACQGKDADVIVFGGSCDYILLVDTVSIFIYVIFETITHCNSWNAKFFPCVLQSKRYMWCTFMRAPLIVSFSGSLQRCTCFPDAALSSIQVIKKVFNAASASLNKPPVHRPIVLCYCI